MNAVVKDNHVETIFDHGVTQDELLELFEIEGYPTPDEYYELKHDAYDSLNADLYRLFKLRNDKQRALYYLSLIKNADYKRCVAQPMCFH